MVIFTRPCKLGTEDDTNGLRNESTFTFFIVILSMAAVFYAGGSLACPMLSIVKYSNRARIFLRGTWTVTLLVMLSFICGIEFTTLTGRRIRGGYRYVELDRMEQVVENSTIVTN